MRSFNEFKLLWHDYAVQLATPDADPDRLVKTIAICAGSGGSMFQDVEADLYLTGEMQHVRYLIAPFYLQRIFTDTL